MYIRTSEFVSFKRIQYSTSCQNRGCICISSIRRTYRSNPAVSCNTFSHPDKKLNSANRIISSRRGERDIPVHLLSLQIQRFYKCFYMQSSHPSKELSSPYRINSSPRNTRLIPCRLLPGILQYLFPMHPSILHSRKWPGLPYKDSQPSSNSIHRNSILSGRQHPHRPYKIPQAHFYRILQGELGFFQKGLSIALSCSAKVSDFRNSLFTVSCA